MWGTTALAQELRSAHGAIKLRQVGHDKEHINGAQADAENGYCMLISHWIEGGRAVLFFSIRLGV